MRPGFTPFFAAVVATLLSCFQAVPAETTPPYRKVTELNRHHPISILYVDEASQKALGKFPIDRRHYADLLTQLAPAKPRFVVLKFFFTDPRPGDAALIRALQTEC